MRKKLALQQMGLVLNSSVPAAAGAFVVCWTPGLVTLLLDGLLGKASHANMYEKFCLASAECNSLVNPVIYTLRDKEMRRTFRWILCGRRVQREASPLQLAPAAAATPQVGVQDPAVELLPGRWTAAEPRPVFCQQETVDFVQKSEEQAAKSDDNENSWGVRGAGELLA